MALGPRDYVNPNLFYADNLRFMENSVLAFLQALFSTFPKEPVDGVGKYHFDPESDANCDLFITGANTDNQEIVDSKPRIIVARGPVSFQQAGINGMIGSQNLSVARQKHATILQGTVGISCFSREELEADRLAEICASAIEAFNPVIRKYGYLEIRTAQIGQRAIIRADARPEVCITPVLVKTAITKNWNREVVDPVKLRNIILQVCAKPSGSE